MTESEILRTGDLISFVVPPPLVIPTVAGPVPLIGSATGFLVLELPACVQGDELPQVLQGPQPYTRPPFVIPGLGTLQIILLPMNLSTQHLHQGLPLLLRGSTFNALFQVTTPAQQPTPAGPVPDPQAVTPLTASFITTNLLVKTS